jgi:hypothetical protein
MDYSKAKPGYLSLKRTLESTKYKLKYSRTQEKHLSPNTSFPVSLQPTRKPSEVLMKNSSIVNNSIEKSTVYHYEEEPCEFSESFDTCFYSFSKNNQKSTQTKKVQNFCSKCGKGQENEVNQEIKELRDEVTHLREALKDIQNLLGIDRNQIFYTKNNTTVDTEDKRSTGFCKLQDKLNFIQKMYEC